MEGTQQIVAVLAVLGLLATALWLLRRKGMAQFVAPGLRRKAGRRYLTPIGYARVYVQQASQLVLAGMARTFDDLRDILAALPDAAPIEIQLIMNAAIVGNGHYVKTPDGVSVRREFGACQGLPL